MRKEPCKYYEKYKGIYVPRCGCEPCWDKYFHNNLGETAMAEYSLQRFGNRGVDAVCGEKYRKQLIRFVSENGSPLEAYKEQVAEKVNEEVRERVDVQPGQEVDSTNKEE